MMSSILSKAFERKRVSSRGARRLALKRLHCVRRHTRRHGGSTRRHLGADRLLRGETERVEEFVTWCAGVGIKLHPNVSIQREGSCDGLGVVATDSIGAGECVAVIPRTALLSCENCEVKDLVIRHIKKIHGYHISSWIPLLLALTAEYSYQASSKWYPYLSIVPSETSSLPMFWPKSVRRQLLQGTAMDCRVSDDLRLIELDYKSLVYPFVKRQSRKSVKAFMTDCDVYRQLVAFVMSYSFTDEGAGFLGETMMVPFVDLLNHSSNHHVELTFHPKSLKLMAVRDIAKGEEVMNTYGEQLPNFSLLYKYGFTERENPFERAVISCKVIQEVYLECCLNPNHWDTVSHLGVMEEEYYVNVDGQVEPHLLLLVRLLQSKFKAIESLQNCLQPNSLQECAAEELSFLTRVAEHCLTGFPPQAATPTSAKESHSWQVVLGQQDSLRNLISLANTHENNASFH